MFNRNFASSVVLAIALLGGAGALAGHARQNDKPNENLNNPARGAASTGLVDMDRVYAASDMPRQLEQRAGDLDNEARQRMARVAAMIHLTEPELMEYFTLAGKAAPTDAEAARAKALETLSDQRGQELQTLAAKNAADLTVGDKARQRELTAQPRLLEQILPNLRAAFRAQQSAQLETLRHEQYVQLRGMVGQVAKEKGVANVFDANALVYSSNDLTPLVIQRLAKRAGK